MYVDTFTQYVSDLISVWYVMAISVGTAFLLGIIFMLFMRCCAGVIVFFSLIAILIIIAGGACWLYFIGRG
jgi:vacuolar-type H+-ATPase subunit I/STV1